MNAWAQLIKLNLNVLSLLGQNLVLIYPLLLYLLLMSLFIIQLGTAATNPLLFLSVLVMLFLLAATFSAGWFAMAAQGARNGYVSQRKKQADRDAGRLLSVKEALKMAENNESLEGKRIDGLEPDPILSESWSLFKAFVPGVGQFFLQLGLGWTVVLLVAWLFLFWLPSMTGGEIALEAAVAQSNSLQFSMDDFYHLSGGFLAFCVLFWMTIFWIPEVIVNEVPFWTGMARSIKLFLKDPLRLSVMGLFFLGVNGCTLFFLFISGALGVPLLPTFIQLGAILFQVYTVLWLFVYLGEEIGVPSWETALDDVLKDAGHSSLSS